MFRHLSVGEIIVGREMVLSALMITSTTGSYLSHVVIHLSLVAQCYSVIGDKPFLWSKAKFDPP